MRALLLVLGLAAVAAGPARADAPKSEALVVLDRAIAGQKDAKALAAALGQLDALLAKNAKDPDAHYARGWVLSRLARHEDAIAAYDQAFALDKTLADAPYNAGVVLGRLGKAKEAAEHFERALAVAPSHVDAAYNAGQSYYDLGEFAKAAARWETAAKLEPEDFQTAKKLVQAYVALGKPAKAKAARARVFGLWKAQQQPERSYVYDQFHVGRFHVYVYEAFEPTGDLDYVYQAKVTLDDKALGSVNLETSAALRASGVPYILGIDKPGQHSTLAQHTWRTLPDYASWKKLAKQLIAERF